MSKKTKRKLNMTGGKGLLVKCGLVSGELSYYGGGSGRKCPLWDGAD